MEEHKIIDKDLNENQFESQTDNVNRDNNNKNKERFNTHCFLTYIGKYEISYDSLINNIFWISLLEGFLWILLLALFISKPSKLMMMWFFIVHFIRAIIGFAILKYIPYSFKVIEDLKDYEKSSLKEIQSKMLDNFRSLLINNQPRLKPLLTIYFILTILNLLVDISLFFTLLFIWGEDGYGFTNVIILLSVSVFFCIFL